MEDVYNIGHCQLHLRSADYSDKKMKQRKIIIIFAKWENFSDLAGAVRN